MLCIGILLENDKGSSIACLQIILVNVASQCTDNEAVQPLSSKEPLQGK